MKPKFRTFLLYLLLAAVYLTLINTSAIFIPFAHHDQYRCFLPVTADPKIKENTFRDPEFNWVWGIGRPITALIEGVVFTQVHEVWHLSCVRAIVVAMLAILLAWMACWFQAWGFRQVPSFGLAAAICTLPGLQFAIFQGTLQNILVLYLAFWASILIHGFGLPPVTPAPPKSRLKATLRYLLACVMLMAAMLAYPTSAYLFLVPTLMLVLFGGMVRWRTTRRRVVHDLLFVAAASGLYFVLVRLVFFGPGLPPGYQVALGTDWRGKLAIFFSEVNRSAFNIWNVYTNWNVTWFVLALILSGALITWALWALRNPGLGIRRLSIGRVGQATLAVLALLVASNLPFLAASTSTTVHRTRLIYVIMIVLLLVWSLKSWFRLLPGWAAQRSMTVAAVAIMSLSGLLAGINMLLNVRNAGAELNFVTAQVASRKDQEISQIHIVGPRWGNHHPRSYAGITSYADEFNHNSLNIGFVADGVARAGLLRLADKSSFDPPIPPTDPADPTAPSDTGLLYSYSKTPLVGDPPPGVLVIDMNDLVAPRGKKPRLRVRRGALSVPSPSRDIVARAVWDGGRWTAIRFHLINRHGIYPFWEAAGMSGKPHWLHLISNYGNQTYTHYSVRADNNGGVALTRMPSQWALEGSRDGVTWHELDRRHGQVDWTPDETRTYKIATPGPYSKFRFALTTFEGIIRLAGLRLLEGPATAVSLSDSPRVTAYRTRARNDAWTHVRFAYKADKVEYPFWEVAGDGPHLLRTDVVGPPQTVARYALQAGGDAESAGRMPAAWILEGSGDGEKWVPLDTQDDQRAWTPGQQRVFEVSSPAPYAHYRFAFRKSNCPGLLRIAGVRLLERPPLSAVVDRPAGLLWRVKELERDGRRMIELPFNLSLAAGGLPFWEIEGPYPHSLEIRVNSGSFALKRYGLQTGRAGDAAQGRMPTAWTLEGSDDGAAWVTVDRQAGRTGWTIEQERFYDVPTPRAFRRYRFTFTAGSAPGLMRLYVVKLQGQFRPS